ncbi:MAG: OadG family protein [Anaerolineae bacterium]
MNQDTLELLRQGLIITVTGMGLVFAALTLLWGTMRLLSLVFRERQTAEAGAQPAPETSAAAAGPDPAVELLTAERAHVAAIVAGALLSNALPLLFEPPPGPTFEHGRSAPSWVVSNRSHALQCWHPPRKPESYPAPSGEY